MDQHTSTYYFRPAAPRQPIEFARYVHRARAVKQKDPSGVYAVFNLSPNKKVSDKPTLNKGSAIIG